MHASIWTLIGKWRLTRAAMAAPAAIFLLATPAQAFTEVEIVPSVPGTSVVIAPEELRGSDTSVSIVPPAHVRDLPPLGLIDLSRGSQRETGTVLSIPGIGTIGVLPRLDFGLELLYGAPKEPKAGITGQPMIGRDQGEDSDVLIRGTIKHRF
jgi:hypothetical protein